MIQQELKNVSLYKKQDERNNLENNTVNQERFNNTNKDLKSSRPQGTEYQSTFPYVNDNNSHNELNFKKRHQLQSKKEHTYRNSKFYREKGANYINFKLQKLKRIREKLQRENKGKYSDERIQEAERHGENIY